MTYTEGQVQKLIEENLHLKDKICKLSDELSEEVRLRCSAEKEYHDLCERCIRFYISEREIDTDTIHIQINAPRFMSEGDFRAGVINSITSLCVAERTKFIFGITHTDSCKDR